MGENWLCGADEAFTSIAHVDSCGKLKIRIICKSFDWDSKISQESSRWGKDLIRIRFAFRLQVRTVNLSRVVIRPMIWRVWTRTSAINLEPRAPQSTGATSKFCLRLRATQFSAGGSPVRPCRRWFARLLFSWLHMFQAHFEIIKTKRRNWVE